MLELLRYIRGNVSGMKPTVYAIEREFPLVFMPCSRNRHRCLFKRKSYDDSPRSLADGHSTMKFLAIKREPRGSLRDRRPENSRRSSFRSCRSRLSVHFVFSRVISRSLSGTNFAQRNKDGRSNFKELHCQRQLVLAETDVTRSSFERERRVKAIEGRQRRA